MLVFAFDSLLYYQFHQLGKLNHSHILPLKEPYPDIRPARLASGNQCRPGPHIHSDNSSHQPKVG